MSSQSNYFEVALSLLFLPLLLLLLFYGIARVSIVVYVNFVFSCGQ